ncbi:MAG TPA: hypothetical protein PK513_05290 [Alphaproteobacteria bacterium]|nr:hypothetical protein [Alphaproteobacteria bacterium]USO05012.1 MAG: hypothetical protein H6859_07570 [Rhodospirillales bacterium]HOO81895.1 hypothetical protein [Alphaproteobacteria bacterium]
MSKTKVAANHYLAEVSQSVDGGGRLGRDFWVAVRDFNRYEPSDITLSQYSQQYHTPSNEQVRRKQKRAERLGELYPLAGEAWAQEAYRNVHGFFKRLEEERFTEAQAQDLETDLREGVQSIVQDLLIPHLK